MSIEFVSRAYARYGQQPQSTVQTNIGIDALYRSRALTATVSSTGGQSAFGEVFLRTVKHAPKVGAVVVKPVRHQDF